MAEKDSKQPDSKSTMFSDEDRKKESSKAAQQAQEAGKKAHELTQAAAGAGDPEERQKLLNQALEKEIEAESFGKTAKYLQSGSFQGMAAGTGLGVIPGVSLGTITGALVGGLTSTITGGLGAAIGTAVGTAHGPFFKLSDMAGSAIRKVTGDIPGWEATEDQQKALEKMLGQVKETDRPSDDELSAISQGGGEIQQAGSAPGGSQSWSEYAASYVPSFGGGQDDGSEKKSWTETGISYLPSWQFKGGEGADKKDGGDTPESQDKTATAKAPQDEPTSSTKQTSSPSKATAKQASPSPKRQPTSQQANKSSETATQPKQSSKPGGAPKKEPKQTQ
jgi:hypothetical protein